jgi:hypothetical protein
VAGKPRTSVEGSSPRARSMHLTYRRLTRLGKRKERQTAALFALLAQLQERQLSDRSLVACSSGLWFVPDVYDVRLVFAHRAFCASEIFLRAAAERVRFGLFGLACVPVRRRPTKLPITWITWSRRPRSFSSSFNTAARSAMYSPSVVRNNCPSILQIKRYRRQATVRRIGQN